MPLYRFDQESISRQVCVLFERKRHNGLLIKDYKRSRVDNVVTVTNKLFSQDIYSWIGTHNHAPGFYANFAMNNLLLNDSLVSFCRLWSFDSATGRGLCYVRHSTSSFYPRTVLAFRYCHCLRLCVCVCACINNLFVCAITRDPLKLGSLICSKNAKDLG